MPVTRWRIFWIWYYLDNKAKFCYNFINFVSNGDGTKESHCVSKAERENKWQILIRVKFAIFVLLHI